MQTLQNPNPLLYYIGKGKVSFKKNGNSTFRDLGNAPVFEVAPEITQLDHFSSRTGVKTKDRTVTTEKSGKVNITLEEWSFENLRLALLGGPLENSSSGGQSFELFGADQVDGQLKFEGTNDVGPRFEIIVSNVTFVPGKSINPISEGWGVLELVGNILADANGSFGTVTELTAGDATDEASSEVPSDA
jgi:hypothetical protein